MPEMIEVLLLGARMLQVELSAEMVEKFSTFYRLLLSWNEKMNLTAITEPEDVAVKHFIDSLTCFSVISLPRGAAVIDIGTGAGFPGIPLKIIRPDLQLTLVDSLQKRVAFLTEAGRELAFSSFTPIHGRAEELGQDKQHRERYDLVVSRAVAALPLLAELCLPFAKVGGNFLAMKGPDGKKELLAAQNALAILGGGEGQLHSISLPVSGDKRTLIVIPKNKPIPRAYPRRPGIPQKKPL